MSVSYYMVSDTEAIHVAQVGGSGFTFYYGEVECMKVYKDFLCRNMDQTLRFLSEHVVWERIDSGEIKEIEWGQA